MKLTKQDFHFCFILTLNLFRQFNFFLIFAAGMFLYGKKLLHEAKLFLGITSVKSMYMVFPFSEPIAIDRKTVVCPFIDVIDYDTLAYRAQDEGARGAFDWELYYKRLPLLPEDLKHPSEPFR